MKKVYLLYIFLLLQPIIDLITSFMIYNTNITLSISIITRGIVILLLSIYVLFNKESKYKKISTLYLVGLLIFSCLYFISKDNIFNPDYLVNEVIYIFKFTYLPIIFIGILNLIDNYKIKNKKIYVLSIVIALEYALLIILPWFTNTSYLSYDYVGNGIKGWFYSTNDITSIICLLFPFSFYIIHDKFKYFHYLIFPILLIPLMLIGTKTSLVGLILSLTFFTLYILLSKSEIYIKIIAIISISFIISMTPYIPAYQNFENKYNDGNDNQNVILRLMGKSFSLRYDYYKDAKDVYLKSDIKTKLLGIGFTDRLDTNNYIYEKLIEMDVFDILFRYGIIGIIIIFMPLLYMFYRLFKALFFEKVKISFDMLLSLYIIFLGLLISVFQGHVLGTPSASIYIAIAMVLLINTIDYQKIKK
jgi:hypothetical protein